MNLVHPLMIGAGGLLAARSLVQRRTFVRFDGVSQHVLGTGALPAALFPGGPGPSASFTILTWIRGTDAPEASSVKLYAAVTCTGDANAALELGFFRPTGLPAQHRFIGNRIRSSPSVTLSSRVYWKHSWATDTMASPSEWRLIAQISAAGSHNMFAHGAMRPSAGATALTDYNNPTGAYFSLNGYVTSAGVLSGSSTMALDYRAPAVYMSALSEAQLQAIEAAGPTYDHASAGAAGWWPGDGDTYPTLRNLGSAGSAWDLTLKNGSQSMIMEE